LSVRVTPTTKKDLENLFHDDPRRFGSFSEYVSFLIEEAVHRALPTKEVARRQAKIAKRAYEKVQKLG